MLLAWLQVPPDPAHQKQLYRLTPETATPEVTAAPLRKPRSAIYCQVGTGEGRTAGEQQISYSLSKFEHTHTSNLPQRGKLNRLDVLVSTPLE